MATSEHFTDRELRCRHCGENRMQADFLAKLEQVRAELGRPMHITSGYRCPVHNQAVSHTGPRGPHTTGRAVDVRCRFGRYTVDLVEAAVKNGIRGIGVSLKKGRPRFLHLTDLYQRVYSY